MTEQLKIGSVVRRKSGGPKMTVESEPKDGSVSCGWFNGGDPQFSNFPVEALELVPPEDKTAVPRPAAKRRIMRV